MNGRATAARLAGLIAEHIDYDRLADAIADRLENRASPTVELVPAKAIAPRIGRSPRWVREHKAELGGVPMGDGPRPRWGFDPAEVDRLMAARRL
jgi:hypothetical protein